MADKVPTGEPQSWTWQELPTIDGEHIVVTDRKASGTNGGTFTAGAYQTRDLNTVEQNTISGASLSANQITLPAGDYRVNSCVAIADRVDVNKLRLQNITDAVMLVPGISTRAKECTPAHLATCCFTLAAAKVLELQHRGQTTQSGTGFGTAAGFGEDEVYAMIHIQKIG